MTRRPIRGVEDGPEEAIDKVSDEDNRGEGPQRA